MSLPQSRYFKMSIDYASATRAASGEVWDIDGKEQYQITAIGTSGATLATLTSPRGCLNGLPWTWSFDTESDEVGISTIEVSFASDQSTLRGFAFDNFNATQANPLASAVAAPSVGNAHAAPLPDAAVLIAVGLVGHLERTQDPWWVAVERLNRDCSRVERRFGRLARFCRLRSLQGARRPLRLETARFPHAVCGLWPIGLCRVITHTMV